MKDMKHGLVAVLCLGLFSLTSLQAKELDRVYAIINDDVITKSEFEQERNSTLSELKARNRELPNEAVLQKQILERMINDRLQLQVADQLGLTISPAQVNTMIGGIAQRNNVSLQQLRETLAADGISYQEFSNRIEEQLKIQQLIERRINAQVEISDQEIEEFLRSESQGTGLDSELNVSHIVVPIPEDNPQGFEQAQRMIERAEAALQAGDSFAAVASQYSAFADALDGGVIGWKKSGELPAFYYQSLRGLREGEFSEILQSEKAFHIVKLNGVRESTSSGEQMMTQLKLRQIFLQFEPNTSPEFLRIRLNEIAQRLNNGEEFSELAQQYSEDANSRIKGGDLGWINPGDFGPEIENLIYRLPVGQISEPVQVRNGISIFEVTERREEKAGDLFEKNAAREQLHIRKAEQMYQQWLQELRDNAYIQLLIDNIG